MAAAIYSLCALTALTCAGLLLRSYLLTRNGLLLWSAICFGGLTLSNILLVIDKLLVTQVDLSPWRHALTLISLLIFIFGLLWDGEP